MRERSDNKLRERERERERELECSKCVRWRDCNLEASVATVIFDGDLNFIPRKEARFNEPNYNR